MIKLNNSTNTETLRTRVQGPVRPLTPPEVTKRVGVVALYLLTGLLHLIEAPLALLTGNIQRARLNLTAIKITGMCLYTFFVQRNHPLSSRFDFHHMSYGLLAMLLPGRAGNFGKWITTCSLVNYDHFGGFGYLDGQTFAPDGANGYHLRPDMADGSLNPISQVTIQDGSRIIRERAYPADVAFVRHATPLAREIFDLTKPAPYLDVLTGEKDRIIDAVIKPELLKIANDPKRRKPAIDIDYDLFKNSLF